MGIRSDVAVCIKREILGNMPPLVSALINENAETHEHVEGMLYVFTDIKWYIATDENIRALYDWLRGERPDNFLVVEACSEDPQLDDGYGQWQDNPWNVYREIVVRLSYEV